jgi:RNA polymerase sigma-70 factor (ECF subfamily)
LDEPRRGQLDGSAELEAELRAALDDARVSWPNLHVDDDAVVAALARALMRGPAHTPADWLRAGTMRDFYLACGCAARDPVALAAFESRYMAMVDPALQRLGIDQAVIDEAKQNARFAVLVGAGSRGPAIAEYTGAGNLKGWLRVIVINAARRLLRQRGDAPVRDVDFDAMAGDREHRELDSLKAQYREQFKVAFANAVTGLSARDRTLLRQHYLLGLTVDQLAPIYGVHRATCARRIEKCRETVYAQTRLELVRSLRIDRAEFEDIMALIESQFDVSVRRYLEEEE